MNWVPTDPTSLQVGQFIRWIELNFSPNYQDRSASGYRATVGEVKGVTATGLHLRVVASTGEDPIALTQKNGKTIFRKKSKLRFCSCDVREGDHQGTAIQSAEEALTNWTNPKPVDDDAPLEGT